MFRSRQTYRTRLSHAANPATTDSVASPDALSEHDHDKIADMSVRARSRWRAADSEGRSIRRHDDRERSHRSGERERLRRSRARRDPRRMFEWQRQRHHFFYDAIGHRHVSASRCGERGMLVHGNEMDPGIHAAAPQVLDESAASSRQDAQTIDERGNAGEIGCRCARPGEICERGIVLAADGLPGLR